MEGKWLWRVDGDERWKEMRVAGNEDRWGWRVDGDGDGAGLPCASRWYQLGRGMLCPYWGAPSTCRVPSLDMHIWGSC